jgi:hypothetical protein
MPVDTIWVFVNSREPLRRIEVVGLTSAREFALFLRHDELAYWHAQEKGIGTAKPVQDCPLLLSTAKREVPVIPIQIASIAKKSSEQRNQKRIAADYHVVLQMNNKVFETYTKNVSSGGLLLRDPVPEYFHMHVCNVTIDSGDNLVNLQFKGKVLSSSSSGSRIKFEGEAAQASLEKLLTFIDGIEKKQRSGKVFKIG